MLKKGTHGILGEELISGREVLWPVDEVEVKVGQAQVRERLFEGGTNEGELTMGVPKLKPR